MPKPVRQFVLGYVKLKLPFCHSGLHLPVRTRIIQARRGSAKLAMKTILAAVDQSHHAHDVMSLASELAVLLRKDLVVLSVISSDPMKQFNIVEEQNRLASFHRELIFKHFPENSLAVEQHGGNGGVYRYGTPGIRVQSRILSGNVVDKICGCAEEVNADIVLLGSRGLGNIGSLVLGSVSERVVHKCQRSVLVVKGERLEDPGWEEFSHSHKSGVARA